MKTRKFSRKLILNKKTIAHLNNGEMSIAVGGMQSKAVPITVAPDPTCVCTALYTNCATETTSIPPAECCICAYF